jgi:hypothetical protein
MLAGFLQPPPHFIDQQLNETQPRRPGVMDDADGPLAA